MKIEKSIKFSTIGEVAFRKNKRAKHLAIRINQSGNVMVTVPGWCSYGRAEKFVLEKQSWIAERLRRINERDQERFSYAAGDRIPLLKGEIQLEQGTQSMLDYMQVEDNYLIMLPVKFDSKNDEHRMELNELIARIGLDLGKEILPAMVEECAKKHGFSYGKVTVRRMKSRWGSCSHVNNISLNSALVFLPRKLADYVILHELVHTIHKNHGQEFWNTMNKLNTESNIHRRELKQQAIIA